MRSIKVSARVGSTSESGIYRSKELRNEYGSGFSIGRRDSAMDARREQFASTLAAALDDAQKRGEVALSTDPRSAAALVIGPLQNRSTIERAAIEADLVEAAVNAVGTWK